MRPYERRSLSESERYNSTKRSEGKWVMKHEIRDILYMHVQASERFVITSGMSFSEFASSLEYRLNHVLLLKHGYDETEFNLNVSLDYVVKENVAKLVEKDVRPFGDFCWVDFKEETSLDELNGTELAELLYLGHMKHHLKQPFFSKLHNQFVYLAKDDEWFSKIYYRSIATYYKMLGNLLSIKFEEVKTERNWFGFRKKRGLPPVPVDVLANLSAMLSEGLVFSFKNAVQTRTKIEIPVWVIGDFTNMDEMLDSYYEARTQTPDAYVTYQGKVGEWSIMK